MNPDPSKNPWLPFEAFMADPQLPSPFGYYMIEVMRPEWKESLIIEPGSIPLAFNVAGLQWRPWFAGQPRFDGP